MYPPMNLKPRQSKDIKILKGEITPIRKVEKKNKPVTTVQADNGQIYSEAELHAKQMVQNSRKT